MNDKPNGNVDRREFLKMLGAGAITSLAALNGCNLKKQGSAGSGQKGDDVPTDLMTYRTNPKNGDKISLLGYGCMRLPRVPKAESLENENDIDQEAVNASIDYALAHGINYFDTSPMYCKGMSERSTGIALNRHPRNKYFIATKMSNQRQKSREESLEIYRKSFKNLKVDYLDYYLVHGVGKFSVYKERYLDNGILDFLLREREAGQIRNLG